MKIKNILITIMIVLLLGTVWGCKKNNKVIEDFPTIINDLNSYKLVGKLYTMFPTGTKESIITTYYKKPDYYRVEIDNENIDDKQIILKNDEGVHVLIPSVNKSFKIKSAWPINSSYPYLLQSLSKDIISDDGITITKEENKTIVSVKAKVFEDANPTTQKIIFDNDTKMPTEVLVYDENMNLLSRFVIEKIEKNLEISDDLFLKNQTLASIRLDYDDVEYTREVTYPTYYPINTSLKEEKVLGDSVDKIVIMNFTGEETAYTIIEEYVNDTDALTTTYVDGDIYVIGGNIYIINGTTICFINRGVEYTLASTSVNPLELVKIGDSLLVNEEK